MKVTYAHLCDYATISRDGKLSAMGIFDQIFVHALPAIHPLMHVAFELELRAAELDRRFDLLIKLVDQDGGGVAEMAADGQIQAVAPPSGEFIRVPQIFGLGGIPLSKLGRYSLDIFVNGDHKIASTFNVSLVVVPEPPVEPPGFPQ